jgi:NAD(P)-dependent dehydrogenase (short-subunit alcohol dehydrogenase family)
MFSLQNKAVVITEAGSGIGKAIALSFVQQRGRCSGNLYKWKAAMCNWTELW